MPRAKPQQTPAAAVTASATVAAKKSTKAETVKAAAIVKTETITETVAETEPVDTWANSFTDFAGKLQTAYQSIAALKSDFKALERECARRMKQALRDGAKRKRKAGNRSPSGFVKPTLISNELASFLKKPAGSELARTEVTREINSYIRSHGLQDKDNGRKINPDKALAKLLKLKPTDELTYFNLQRYMSPHFQKAADKAAAAAAAAAAK
jgi:chromatin remodeling complex protein RSC6